jgi:outer membrane protein assembly factor BamB
MDVPAPADLLFVGTYGWIAALNRFTGAEAWRTSLPRAGWGVVTLLHEEGVLYAAAGGHVYALDPATGAIAWHNALSGLGKGHLCLATLGRSPNSGEAPVPQIAEADDEAKRHRNSGQ